MKPTKIIPAFEHASRIKRALRKHLKNLGFDRANDGTLSLATGGKEAFRNCHAAQRAEKFEEHASFLKEAWPLYRDYFASGSEIVPEKIEPRLEVVDRETWQADLFKLATLTWSVPVSNGYGRRMRFLVWDNFNGKLMGLIGLTDPVFNLRARDTNIGWSSEDRRARLTCMMDAHILGALPPYNQLLGGKLVSSLIRSSNVRDMFRKKYAASIGVISGKAKNARLIAVTTSSSLGKSSVYNRLKLDGQSYFAPIGYTEGFGHFQIPQNLFEEMRRYLGSIQHSYADGNDFGTGPNWRLRTIRACLDEIGFNANILQHNLKREVFICPLASNYRELLRGEQKRAAWTGLKSISEISRLAIDRWVIPRSLSRPEWRLWVKDSLLAQINGQEAESVQLKHGTGV
ncbi:hypothetical protein BH09VER1_BH09VER1_16190 [soil metagenome]